MNKTITLYAYLVEDSIKYLTDDLYGLVVVDGKRVPVNGWLGYDDERTAIRLDEKTFPPIVVPVEVDCGSAFVTPVSRSNREQLNE